MDARPAECAGPGRGGGLKTPASSAGVWRSNSGRRFGAADSIAPRIPPGQPNWCDFSIFFYPKLLPRAPKLIQNCTPEAQNEAWSAQNRSLVLLRLSKIDLLNERHPFLSIFHRFWAPIWRLFWLKKCKKNQMFF